METVIRKLKEQEMPEAKNLIWDVFLEFEAPEYVEEGIQTFRNCLHEESFLEKHEFLGAFEEERLLGVLASRNDRSHIAMFFVDKSVHGRGVGRKLFEHLLDLTSAEKITVNSSPYAVEIYRRLGFVDLDKEQLTDGIRYVPMQYMRKDSLQWI